VPVFPLEAGLKTGAVHVNVFMAGAETRPTQLNKQERSAKMIVGKEKRGTAGRYLLSLFVLLTAASLLACVAAIPIIYLSTREGGVVVTAQIERDADEVWEAVVRTAEKLPDVKIVERDDEEFFLKAVEEGTENRGGIKVTSIGEGKSQVIVRGEGPGEKDASERLSVRIVEDICNELGVKYTLVEG
jgi:hypothetical protein